MTTKERVLELLRSRQGQFLSGQEIGDTLHVTRSAIWKAIKSLREQGLTIEAVTNMGYRLPALSDELSPSRILHLWKQHEGEKPAAYPPIYLRESVDSTNEWAKRVVNGREELPDQDTERFQDSVFIANEQTRGRGRRGRAFFSAPDTGIYMSLLLDPGLAPQDAAKLTGMTAVAACEAIEECTGLSPEIKWVNDLYLNDRKIAGILTEGTISLEDGCMDHVIIGIGINLFPPSDGFPKEIQQTAGSLFPAGNAPEDLRNTLIAAFLHHFEYYYHRFEEASYLEGYRNRSYLKGKWVKIITASGVPSKSGYARVIGIDDEMHLIVEHENGKQEALSTGEVSVVKY